MPSCARGYHLCSCCKCLVSSVINKQRFSPVLLLELLVEQCNQQAEILSGAAVATADDQCNQQLEIHSGGVVSTTGIAVPSRARGYLLCSCCKCLVSSVINKQRLSTVLLLELLVEQCNQQAEILSGASVATAV